MLQRGRSGLLFGVGALLSGGLLAAFAGSARADVELGREPTERELYPYGEGVEPGPGIEAEPLDDAPLELETGFFRGARLGPLPRFGVEGDLMVGRFRSAFQFESEGGEGNEVLAHDDLPLDDRLPAIELRFWLIFAHHWMVNGGYFVTGAEEDGAVTRSFVHDAVPFERGDQVELELSAHLAYAGFTLLAVNQADVKFGIPFGVMWTRQTLDLTNRVTEQKAEGTIDDWSPYLGLYLDLYFGYGLGIEGETRFFAYGEDDEKVFGYFDGRLVAYLAILDHVRLYAGIRGIAIDSFEDDDNDRQSDWRFFGVVAGASIYF